ncbi:hypothetical protein AJ79_00775 [Helicocarpus griseus UAMH5409]|uniref:Uncharacterized protein n=1 Tax=Helicocarpus griseus UAMH5409 TaxID=1447875 RepID=A0A2B7Y8P1_9EURO|nr:hypothetical protein AJ79_00775 [Helicocarpus griseus UAMH5409]
MRTEHPRPESRTPALLRSPRRRRWLRNQGRNPSNDPQTTPRPESLCRHQHGHSNVNDYSAIAGGPAELPAADLGRLSTPQLIRAYQACRERDRILQRLIIANMFLEALQPEQSSNEMDWEPIPPVREYRSQPQRRDGSSSAPPSTLRIPVTPEEMADSVSQ